MITAPRQGINSQRKAFLSGLFDLYLPTELYTSSAVLTGMVAKSVFKVINSSEKAVGIDSISAELLRVRDVMQDLPPTQEIAVGFDSATPISIELRSTMRTIPDPLESTPLLSEVTPISIEVKDVVISDNINEALQGQDIKVFGLKFGN